MPLRPQLSQRPQERGQRALSGSPPRANTIWGRRKSSVPILDIVLPDQRFAGEWGAPALSTLPFSPALDVRAAGSDAGDPVEGEERRWGRAPADSGGPWASALPSAAASSRPLARLRSSLAQVTCGRAASPAARRALRPAPSAAAKLGPQRPAAAGGALGGPGDVGALRPWGYP